MAHGEHTRVDLITVEGNRIAFRDGKWCVLSRDEGWTLARHESLGAARTWRKERYVPKAAASRHVHLAGATGTIRTAMFEDRIHTVVPVVALVEGVIFPVNAKTAELVLAEEFSRTPQGWNGRPVVADHPAEMQDRISANSPAVLAKHAFGTVFGAKVSGKKLLMEAWIDRSKADRAGVADLLRRIDAGEMLEVSVGAFVVTEEKSGTYNGEKYSAIWREIVPDHLALLPAGTTGACSVKMGCGTPRAASQYLSDAGGPGSGNFGHGGRPGEIGGSGGDGGDAAPSAWTAENLTPAHHGAVKAWESSWVTNGDIRRLDGGLKMTKGVAEATAAYAPLLEVLDNAPKFDGPTYRGMVNVDVDKFQVGGTFKVKALSSSSKDLHKAENFTQVTHAGGRPKSAVLLEFLDGASVKADIEPYSQGKFKAQREVVMRKSDWVVESVTIARAKTYFKNIPGSADGYYTKVTLRPKAAKK